MEKCLEQDLENNRIAKLLKKEEDLPEVKKLLLKHYRQIKDCYKYYSTVGAISDIWCIPMNAYRDFCINALIFDKYFENSMFDLIFTSTYTKSDKKIQNPRSPDRALVRNQFIEGLFRIADQKYFTGSNKRASSQKEALQMLLDESIIPFVQSFDIQKWRIERYWNEEVDTVLKSYQPIFKSIYKWNSSLKKKPGQLNFMCLDEFKKIVELTGLQSDKCGERDATLAFNFAFMTNPDELNSNRIFEMQYLEFLEAFARVCDVYSAALPGTDEVRNELRGEGREN